MDPAQFTAASVYRSIRETLKRCYGDVGTALMLGAVTVKYLHPMSHLAVVRCGRDHLTQVRAAITLVAQVAGHDVSLEVFKVCGSPRTCKQALVATQQRFYDRRRVHVLSVGGSPDTVDAEEQADTAAIAALEI